MLRTFFAYAKCREEKSIYLVLGPVRVCVYTNAFVGTKYIELEIKLIENAAVFSIGPSSTTNDVKLK